MFLLAGGLKLAGVEPMVAMFETIGLGQWFRYLTGGLEVTGAILLLIPTTVLVGGSLLAVVVASRRAFPRDTRPRLNGGDECLKVLGVCAIV